MTQAPSNVNYPPKDGCRMLLIRDCTVDICNKNNPASILMSVFLFWRDHQRIGDVYNDKDQTFTMCRTQEEIQKQSCNQLDTKTLHDVAVPLLQLLGYLDIKEKMNGNLYILHMDRINAAYAVCRDKDALKKFLLLQLQAQLEKFLIDIPSNQLEKILINKKFLLLQLEIILIRNRENSNCKRGRKRKLQEPSDGNFPETENSRELLETSNRENDDRPPTSSTGSVNHSSSFENDSHFSERDDTSPSSDQEISDVSPENVQEMSSTSVATVRSEQSITSGDASCREASVEGVSSPSQGGVEYPGAFSSVEGANSASIPATARHEKQGISPPQDTTSQDSSVTTGVKSGNLEEITGHRSAAFATTNSLGRDASQSDWVPAPQEDSSTGLNGNAKNSGLIFASSAEQTLTGTSSVRDGSFPGEVLQCDTNAGSHHPLPSLHDPAFPTAEPPIAVTPDDSFVPDISLPTSGQVGTGVMENETAEVITPELILKWIMKRGATEGRAKPTWEAMAKLQKIVTCEAHVGELCDIVKDQFINRAWYPSNLAHPDVVAKFNAIRPSLPQKNGNESLGMDATTCNGVIDAILDRNPQWESLIYLDETQAPVYFFGISLGNNEWIDIARRKDWDELDIALIVRADAWAHHLATEQVELEAMAV